MIFALGFTASGVSFLCKNSSSSSITACLFVDGCGSKLNNSVAPFSGANSFSGLLNTSVGMAGSKKYHFCI